MLDESSPNQEAEPVNVEATLKEFRTSLKIQNLREAVELSLAVMQTVQAMSHNSKDAFTRLAADMANVVYLVCRLMVDASDKDLAQSTVENIYMLKMTVKDVKMFAEAESKPSIIRRLMRPFKSRVSLLRKVQELRDKLSELLVRFNVPTGFNNDVGIRSKDSQINGENETPAEEEPHLQELPDKGTTSIEERARH